MKFVDEIEIRIRAGHGGAGAVSFLREKYRAQGGPDGGDGGRGGDFIIRSSPSLQNLNHVLQTRNYRAENGEPGRGNNQSGAGGSDAELRVPVGTEILDAETGELIADLYRSDQTFVIAKGGKGGLGNQHFATSSNQAPTYAQPGLPGDERRVILRLKLLADAGLVGLPNAGKSTLLAAVTRKLPKIADYAFTTLTPNIGVAENESFRRLLLADIPGIIEGAHMGHGLGLAFLRHIERVRLIIYVIDVASLDPAGEISLLKNELRSYSEELIERPALIALNKLDLANYEDEFVREVGERLRAPELWPEKGGVAPEVLPISAAEKRGTRELVEKLFTFFDGPTLGEESLPGAHPVPSAPPESLL